MLSEKSLRKASLFHVGKVNRLMQKLQMSKNPSETDSMALLARLRILVPELECVEVCISHDETEAHRRAGQF